MLGSRIAPSDRRRPVLNTKFRDQLRLVLPQLLQRLLTNRSLGCSNDELITLYPQGDALGVEYLD